MKPLLSTEWHALLSRWPRRGFESRVVHPQTARGTVARRGETLLLFRTLDLPCTFVLNKKRVFVRSHLKFCSILSFCASESVFSMYVLFQLFLFFAALQPLRGLAPGIAACSYILDPGSCSGNTQSTGPKSLVPGEISCCGNGLVSTVAIINSHLLLVISAKHLHQANSIKLRKGNFQMNGSHPL